MFPESIEQQYISFAGGGGKGKAGEAPDTLRSEATLSFVLGLMEGPIAEIPTIEDLEKRIFLNKTPVRNPDGSRNFENCSFGYTIGTQDEEEIAGFTGENLSDFDVNQAIRKDQGPIVRYVSDPTAQAIRFTISVPGLVEQKGQRVQGTAVNLDLLITDATGSVLTRDEADAPGYHRWRIDGKSTSQYEQSRLFTLSGKSPYRVEFLRQTDDSKNSQVRNDTIFSRYTLINYDRFRHPFIAKLYGRISSKDFQGIPEMGMRGQWLMCALPHNYNPVTRAYTGIFDGRFTGYGWTNNPAYVIRQLLTNKRYGVGEEIDPTIHDDWDIYQIGKYCDEMVVGAFGQLEPRFTINGVMTERAEADQQLTTLFEHIRAQWFYANGAIHYLQDTPREVARIYTEANTLQDVDESGRVTRPCFETEGTGRKARHTACIVQYRNKENFHQTEPAYYADEEQIARYGLNLKTLDLPYCDSLGQALREAKAMVLTEKYQKDTIKFRVSSEGQLVQPGQVCAVADPYKQKGRYGGRIKSVSTDLTKVILDAPVYLKPGRSYTLMVESFKQTIACNLSASAATPYIVSGAGFTYSLLGATVGTAKVVNILSPTQLTLSGNPGLGTATTINVDFWINNLQMSRAVITSSGTTDTIQLISPLAGKPPKGGTWVLSDNIQPLDKYTIISVTKASDAEYELSGIAYSDEKFEELEQRGDLPPVTKTLIPPKIVALRGSNYNEELTIGWTTELITQDGRTIANPNISGYVVRYRSPGDNWITLPPTNVPSAVIFPVRAGQPYEIQVAVADISGALHYSEIVTTGVTLSKISQGTNLSSYTLVEI